MKEKYKSRHQESRERYRKLSISRRSRRRRGGVGFSMSTLLMRIIRRKRFLCLLIAWKVEVEVQVWVYVNGLLLKCEPPRGPLSTGLVPQSSNNFISLSNQSYLLIKVPAQSATLLIQLLHRVYSFEDLMMSHIQQRPSLRGFVTSRV